MGQIKLYTLNSHSDYKLENVMQKKINITLSDVLKKDLRVVAFLVSSWAIGLALVYFTNNEKLLGLIPVANYIIFRIEQELSNEGYREALKK